MLKRLLRPCTLALRHTVIPLRNRSVIRPFCSPFADLNGQKVTEVSKPDYGKCIEQVRHSGNVQETKEYLENLALPERLELTNRLVAEIQKNESDMNLQQIAGLISNSDFVSSLTAEVVDGMETLDFKDISHSMWLLASVEDSSVLNKVFVRFRALAGNVRDKETLNDLMRCYFQLLPTLMADPTNDPEFYSMADEILAVIDLSRDSWMDSDVACQLANLIFHSPSPKVLDHLPSLCSSISPKAPISENVFFNLVFCVYLSLKAGITQTSEHSESAPCTPEPGSLHHRIFVENETLNNLFPESTEIRLLNSLEQTAQYPGWRSGPDTSTMKQYAELVLEILHSPIVREFPALRYRLANSFMWILKDHGQYYEVLNVVWKLNCDLNEHDPQLSQTFGDHVKQFVFWILQYLGTTRANSHLRPYDIKQVLDLQEADLPFRHEENFKRNKSPSSLYTQSSEAVPRQVADDCDPLLQSVVTTLVFLNNHLADQQYISFCKEYLENILNLLLKGLPQILETLPDEAARGFSARVSEFNQMSAGEKMDFQNQLQALLQTPDNVSFIRTVKNFRDLAPLLIHLGEFYSTDSELAQNLQNFILWIEHPSI